MADVTRQIAEIDRKLKELDREKKRLKIERRQLVEYQRCYHGELQMNVERVGG